MHPMEGLFICKSTMMALITWTKCLPMKLGMFSMLLYNEYDRSIGANTTTHMAWEAALQRILTVCHVVTFRSTAS